MDHIAKRQGITEALDSFIATTIIMATTTPEQILILEGRKREAGSRARTTCLPNRLENRPWYWARLRSRDE